MYTKTLIWIGDFTGSHIWVYNPALATVGHVKLSRLRGNLKGSPCSATFISCDLKIHLTSLGPNFPVYEGSHGIML